MKAQIQRRHLWAPLFWLSQYPRFSQCEPVDQILGKEEKEAAAGGGGNYKKKKKSNIRLSLSADNKKKTWALSVTHKL